MELGEIQNAVASDSLAAAAQTATTDLKVLRESHSKAEQALGKAESERMRVLGIQGQLQSQASLLLPKVVEARRRAFRYVEDGQQIVSEQWNEERRLSTQRERTIMALSFITSFTLEDAIRACLVAELGEREAFCSLQDGRSARARIKIIAASQQMLSLDPGASVNLESSWSSQTAQETAHIRETQISRLKESIQAHDVRVEAERQLVGRTLWN